MYKLADSSSKLVMMSFWLPQIWLKSVTCVPSGLVNFTIKSLIYVCVMFKFVTFTSVTVPAGAIVSVEVIVGVPVAEIAIGTLVLAKVVHVMLAVVKLNVEDHAPAPQPFEARTRQKCCVFDARAVVAVKVGTARPVCVITMPVKAAFVETCKS